MDELLERCAGLDVHQEQITACIMVGSGRGMRKEIRTFETFTDDLEELCQWLHENEIRDIAMESTGVYTGGIIKAMKVYRGGGLFNPPTKANARHMKNVPGKKTDVNDAQWTCKLLKNGLLKKSFIPPEEIEALRKLTRTRKSSISDKVKTQNRILALLESANIKLATVFTDPFGKCGFKFIQALACENADLEALIAQVPKQVKEPKSRIRKALKGYLTPTDISLLKRHLKSLDEINASIAEIEELINLKCQKHQDQMTLLQTLPGIAQQSAAVITAEIGTNMAQFIDADHLASWAGLAPGNNESAGKKKSSRINPGNQYLKPVLLQCALVAVRNKDSYWAAQYARLTRNLGKKKAIVAIGRRMLKVIYFTLVKQTPYTELGAAHLNKLTQEKKAKYYMKQLEKMGHKVNIEPLAQAQ